MLRSIWDRLGGILTILLPVAPYVAPLIILLEAYLQLPAILASLTTQLNNLANYINVSGISEYLGQADRIFPWSEVMAMLGGLVALKITAAGIRMVKSIIPTVG